MRTDLYVKSVMEKAEALKRAGLWSQEPNLRPSAWLGNFADNEDRLLGAVLLDNLVFYSDRASDRLLLCAFQRLEDAILTNRIPSSGDPSAFLDSLIFTPVEGEHPRPLTRARPCAGSSVPSHNSRMAVFVIHARLCPKSKQEPPLSLWTTSWVPVSR